MSKYATHPDSCAHDFEPIGIDEEDIEMCVFCGLMRPRSE